MELELESRTVRWVEAGLLAAAQAEAILVFERTDRSSDQPYPEKDRGLPALAEAGAYLGAVLATGAAIGLVGTLWEELSILGQVGLLLGTAVALLAGGAWVGAGARHEGPIHRLVGFLWTTATVAVVGAVGVLLDSRALSDETTGLLVLGAVAAAGAGGLWAARRQVLLLVAAWLGAVDVLCAGLALLDVPTLPIALAVGVLGLIGLIGGWRQVLTPRRSALALGSLTLVGAAQFIAFDHRVLGLTLGILSASALIGIGARTRQLVLLGIGVAGLAVLVPQALSNLPVGELTIGIVTLLLGMGVLGAALAAMRGSDRSSRDEEVQAGGGR